MKVKEKKEEGGKKMEREAGGKIKRKAEEREV